MKIPVEKVAQITQALKKMRKPEPTEISVKEVVQQFMPVIINKMNKEGISLDQLHAEMMKYLEPEHHFSLSTLRSYLNEMQKTGKTKEEQKKPKRDTSEKPMANILTPINPGPPTPTSMSEL